MYSIRQFSAFYSHFQVTSGEMTSLSALFRTPEVVTSFPVTWLPPPASYRLVASEMCCTSHFYPSTATSRWLPLKWRHFRVTSGHLRSRDVIFCHVTAFLCGLQPCRKWNVQYMPDFGLLQPLPGEFRSSDATAGSLPVTWGQVTSLPVTWLPPPASYSIVGNEMYSIRQFSAFYSHFQVTSGEMTSLPGHFRSPKVAWRYFLSPECLLLRATAL